MSQQFFKGRNPDEVPADHLVGSRVGFLPVHRLISMQAMMARSLPFQASRARAGTQSNIRICARSTNGEALLSSIVFGCWCEIWEHGVDLRNTKGLLTASI